MSSGASSTVKSGESLRPRDVSMRARWLVTSATACGAVRSSTIATAALRSAACLRKPHGTWSAYLAAEVTNSHRSAAASSWAASVRLRSSTESMSGASRSASPCGISLDATSCKRAGISGGAGGALELGQDPLVVEPRCVVGVVDEHRRARRGTQDAGFADPLPDQRVHQGRLAGTRRTAHDGEQRCVDLHEPWQHVVLELVDHLRAVCPALLDAGDVEGQRRKLQRLSQRGQGGEHLRGAVCAARSPSGRQRVPGVRHRCAPGPGPCPTLGMRTGRWSPLGWGHSTPGRRARMFSTCCWPSCSKSGGGTPRR